MPQRSVLTKILTFVSFLVLWNNAHNVVIAADTTAPLTTFVRTPASPNGKNNWFVTPVTYTLTATDLVSGVKEINYKVDSAPWQKISFATTLNLAPNPSYETTDINSPINTESWTTVSSGPTALFSRDGTTYATGFDNTSIMIVSSSTGGWNAIAHPDDFSVAEPYNNMSASIWLKTASAQNVNFKIFAVTQDGGGGRTDIQVAQSSSVSGTTDWSQLSLNFIVSTSAAIGVYMEVGIEGSGTVWADAVSINKSLTSTTIDVSIGADGEHTLQYYSVDQADNVETTKSSSLKIDQTPPGNWHDSGATRGIFGLPYQLWVYATVEDETSGISPYTDKYQIHTEMAPGYGKYSNFLDCGSTWRENQWLLLLTPPWQPGAKSAYIITPKTSFCNTNWNRCKIVRFYSEDMAGNFVTKDFCINGPWIRSRGEGITRANHGINMLSEAEGDNIDSLIEAGNNQVDFFTSTRDWKVKEYPNPKNYTYSTFWDTAKNKSEMGSTLPVNSGVYYVDGDLTVNSTTLPSNYNTRSLANVIFVDGDLTINTNIVLSSASAVMYVVSGDVKIRKDITEVCAGILADGNFYSGYDVIEGDSTPSIVFRGIFIVNKFIFQRTLQGTNNSNLPSEDFVYQPKYVTKLNSLMGISSIKWISNK